MDRFKFRDKDGDELDWDSNTVAEVLGSNMNTRVDVIPEKPRGNFWLYVSIASFVLLACFGWSFDTSRPRYRDDGMVERTQYITFLRFKIPIKNELMTRSEMIKERIQNGEAIYDQEVNAVYDYVNDKRILVEPNPQVGK